MKLNNSTSKRILVKYQGKIINGLYQNGKMIQLDIEDGKENPSILGNVYIGKVKNIVKNIGVAFIEVGNGISCYYSIKKNKNPYIVNSINGKSQGTNIVVGDEILVQVEKEALKTKEPTVTSKISLTGRYLAITLDGKHSTAVSGKISDDVWKKEVKEKVVKFLKSKENNYVSVIVRTNAYVANTDEILEELEILYSRIEKLMAVAHHRTCYSLLYQAPASYLLALRDTREEQLEEIVTDDKEIYDEILQFMEQSSWNGKNKVRFYEDKLLSLSKLYSLETVISSALQEKVWMKSGAYLVIQHTEALTVIDVNSGKAIKGNGDLEETFYKLNVEAAKEIAHQLRLRNLSGIILVDFIDLKQEENKYLLLDQLKRFVSSDPIKTIVVDMTKLNLVEITRKKVRKPLHEVIKKW